MRSAGLNDAESIKAAEVMATGDSGNGADWIGTAYSTELWRSIRHSGGIVEKIPSVVIPDGYSSEYFPLEDADPTWYTVAETTAKNSTTGVPDASVGPFPDGPAIDVLALGAAVTREANGEVAGAYDRVQNGA